MLALEQALSSAEQDIKTLTDYERVLVPLIYGGDRHPFEIAWRSFRDIAQRMLATVQRPAVPQPATQ